MNDPHAQIAHGCDFCNFVKNSNTFNYETNLLSAISLSRSGEGRLSSAADVSVTRRGAGAGADVLEGAEGAGGGEAGGDDVADADAGDDEPTAESRLLEDLFEDLLEDSEPDVERRRGPPRGPRGPRRPPARLKAAGMCRDAVITQLSSSDPPSVCGNFEEGSFPKTKTYACHATKET